MTDKTTFKLTNDQSKAALPSVTVWVSASAGTGKTKVLISRLLRLLLNGCSPDQILCITYTKTGANEILHRLQHITREWVVIEPSELYKALQDLLEKEPTQADAEIARSLFAKILHTANGMKIMTIHAFCQSVLLRFPFEANIPPHFTIADDKQTHDLMQLAKHHLLLRQDIKLSESFSLFMNYLDEEKQNSLLNTIFTKRYILEQLKYHYNDAEAYYHFLCNHYGFDPHVDPEDLLNKIEHDRPVDLLKQIYDLIIHEPSKTRQKFINFHHQSFTLENYSDLFLTDSRSKRVDIFSGLKKLPLWVSDVLLAEQDRVHSVLHQYCGIKTVQASHALYHVVTALLEIYQEIKMDRGILDYDDQIILTARLLSDSAYREWVMYKVDSRIKHILLDEAQDTSPMQWQIIDYLSEDFFSGDSLFQSGERTVFIVGDEKQSIFSFQNADPKIFYASGSLLKSRTEQSGALFNKVSLIDNFRSSPIILSFVDHVFSSPELQKCITQDDSPVKHKAHKEYFSGNIQHWPLVKVDKDHETQSIHSKLAQKIAHYVFERLKDNTLSRPGDVMILVQKRHPMAAPLIKAFKDLNIPISGPDRTTLHESMAVQDCLSLLQLRTSPYDDYNTACALKSPFIAMSDKEIYTLRYKDPTKNLFENLTQDANYVHIVDYILNLRNASFDTLTKFLYAILNNPCPNDSISGRHALIRYLGYDCDDILDQLIDAAQIFESEDNGQITSFMTWVKQSTTSQKRESNDNDLSRVRLITVHKSKGLQAKLVIIADATQKPRSYNFNNDVLWLDNQNGFIWPVTQELEPQFVTELKESNRVIQFEEYYRLLYVALTRAEQELIICGYEARNSQAEYLNWYDITAQSMAPCATKSGYLFDQENNVISFGDASQEATKIPNIQLVQHNLTDYPHLRTIPPEESILKKPLRPSRILSVQPSAISPLVYKSKAQNYMRGQALHRLFRILPNHEKDQQRMISDHILKRDYKDNYKIKESLFNEVQSVFNHPNFQYLFTPNARTEVPLIGEILLEGKPFIVSGQVDRLLVMKDRVLVIDYKTNRPPVMNETDVPEIYRLQMLSYKLLLEKIYPDRTIQTALLWTAVPYLLPLSL